MKKIFVLIVILLSFVSVTYGATKTKDYLDTSKDYGDCWSLIFPSRRWTDSEDVVKNNMFKAMSKTGLEMAFSNLNKYCCNIKAITWTGCVSTNDKTLYPESIYLFDHIFDIYLRKLDAKTELLYGLEPDWSGKEWREFITEKGNDVKGSRPIEIKTGYDFYWKLTRYNAPFSETDAKAIAKWNDSTTWNISQYDSWTLYDKYSLACDIVNYITQSIQGKTLTESEYQSCTEIVNNRIDRENVYVQTLLMQKANKLLWWNLDSYLGTYFIRDKLSNLEQILFDINTSFWEVNKAVKKLVPKCS